jgi:hypothetical protein
VTAELVPFLQAIAAAGAWTAGLFFLRFWRASRDRLFVLFAMAFWLLALSWALLGLISPTDEARPYIYAIRLVAFLLLIAAILDKNRAPR